MKKISFSILLVLVFALGASSCSNDDENPIEIGSPIPTSGEIKMLIDITEDNPKAELYIEGEGIVIDWGDGRKTEVKDLYSDKHYYLVQGRSYIITITAEQITAFGNSKESIIGDFNETNSTKYKNIAIGDEVEIESFYFDVAGIESLSLPKNNNSIASIRYNKDFDLSHFSDCQHIRIYLAKQIDLNISNLNATTIGITIPMEEKQGTASVKIKDCPKVTSCFVGGSTYQKVTSTIKDLIVENTPLLGTMSISNITAENIDMSQIKSDSPTQSIAMTNTSASSHLLLNKRSQQISISSQLSISANDNMTALDISEFYNLKILTIKNVPALKSIKISELPSLERIHIEDCKKITDLDVSNLPQLKEFYFSFFNESNNEGIDLYSLKIANNKSLIEVDVRNTNLTNAIFENNPKIRQINLLVNNLNEESLLNIINSVTDTPSSRKGILNLAYNPGCTQKVKDAADLLQYWTVDY